MHHSITPLLDRALPDTGDYEYPGQKIMCNVICTIIYTLDLHVCLRQELDSIKLFSYCNNNII